MRRPHLVLLLMTLLIGGPGLAKPARAGLKEYVQKPDSTFAFKLAETIASKEGSVYLIELTSQTWKGITWKHLLRVYEPKGKLRDDAMVLVIAGGNHDSRPNANDHKDGFELAMLCGARVVVLPQVPNQPLLDGKTEDELIAETFVRYLDTKDEDWPLLFPMVKSAVRAMDAVQAWCKASGKPRPEAFVVTGASKRGWTTWLAATQDARIIGIAPMVIDTLNMREQGKHSEEVWGKPSEEIGDYDQRGLLSQEETKERLRLWSMVDPYTYREDIKIPKFLINGTNDRYWTLDALNLYWDGLVGQKAVVYVPNAGHGIERNREYATHAIAAIFKHAVQKKRLPEVQWKHSEATDGSLSLRIFPSAGSGLKSVSYWWAKSRSLDFRDSHWEQERPLPIAGFGGLGFFAHTTFAPDECAALFGDIEYEIDGLTYHLSTQIRQKKGSNVK